MHQQIEPLGSVLDMIDCLQPKSRSTLQFNQMINELNSNLTYVIIILRL